MLAKFHKLYHIAQRGRQARLAQHVTVLFLLFLIFIQVNATRRPAASLSHVVMSHNVSSAHASDSPLSAAAVGLAH